MSEEARYTLIEARRILARQECAHDGHDWDIVTAYGASLPTGLVCARCGFVCKVEPADNPALTVA